MDTIAFLGNFLLALCGLPLAIDAIRTKDPKVPTSFLVVWGLGEILTLIYVLYLMDIYLIMNYMTNLTFIGIVVYYKIRRYRDRAG